MSDPRPTHNADSQDTRPQTPPQHARDVHDTSESSTRPVLAVSAGDPAGIGPEVLVKALAEPEVRALARFRVYGAARSLDAARDAADLTLDWWRCPPDDALIESATEHDLVVVDLADADPFERPSRGARGPTPEGGRVSFDAVERAVADARRAPDHPLRAHGVVTAPISKAAWALAGKGRFPGHTELLQSRFRAKRVAMMFDSPELRVVLATAHIPLMDLRNALTIGRVFDAIDLGARACRSLGIERPRIAVCGVNPHAGENGLLGDEDQRIVEPAIRAARETSGAQDADTIDATGPHPADTVFNRALRGEFDLVVAMYHDQGLIPVKLLAWDRAVNVTLGLPTPRTSPDHGTAFDIAGKNLANPGSMRAAIRLASRLASATPTPGAAQPGDARGPRR